MIPHSLPLPTLDGFFPLQSNTAETDADIRRDITLLSALLKDHRPGQSTVKQGRSSWDSDLWSYIAYTLVPGSSSDANGDNVVAVVGRMEPGSIIATVVARNTSPIFTNDRRNNPSEIDAVVVHPRDVRVVRDKLENPLTLSYVVSILAPAYSVDGIFSDDVPFHDHLRDVISILSYLLDTPE